MHAMDSLATATAAAPLSAPFLRPRASAAPSRLAVSLLRLPRPTISARRRRRPLLLAVASALPLETVSADSLRYDSGFLGAITERTRTVAAEDLHAPGSGGLTTTTTTENSSTSSKVYDVAIESPLDLAAQLSERLGVDVWLKREDLQPVFSFKVRGAYNMMSQLSRAQLDRGVICSSAGNHAQAVALCANKLGCDAVIVMPVTTQEIKLRSVERLGATVVLKGNSFDEAQSYAKWLGEQEGRTFISAFDHPDIITGQGTVGEEIGRQAEGRPLHAVFVPVGGGGLIAGIATHMKRVRPEVKIIGVEPYDSNAMALSLYHGKRIALEQAGGFADGVAIKVVGEEPFRLCRELVDGVVLVSRDAICASIKDMFEETRRILEPAGALALAGAEAYCKYYGLKDTSVAVITSGANMNFKRLSWVAELTDIGRKQEAAFTTVLPEESGSFRSFCKLVGDMNVTEFKYRSDPDRANALVFYSVAKHTVAELQAMVDSVESAQLEITDITNDDLSKDHFRYFMGGPSDLKDEVLCRFIFPEVPGALTNFLDAFSPRWNISLFHYRAQAEGGANVLAGFIVPRHELLEFRKQAQDLGYNYTHMRALESPSAFVTV